MSLMFTSLIGTSDAPVPAPPETLIRLDFGDEYVESSVVTIIVESNVASSDNVVDWGDGTSDTYGAGVTTLTHEYTLCVEQEVCDEYCEEYCDEWFDEETGEWVYDDCWEDCSEECWTDNVCNYIFDISIKGVCHKLQIRPGDWITASMEVLELSSALTDCSNMFLSTRVRADVLRIPDGVTDCSKMFENVEVHISEIIIPPSVVNASSFFCEAFNGEVIVEKITFLPGRASTPPNMFYTSTIAPIRISLITVPDSVEDCSRLFADAYDYAIGRVVLPPTIKNCSYMFSFSSMSSLPAGFTIPAGVENCEGMFAYYVADDTDIANLLADWSAADTGTRNVKEMFYMSCFSGTAPAEKLWLNHNINWANTSDCFTGCTGLDNYEEIPESWGGNPPEEG